MSKGNPNYRKGRAFEYQLIQRLRKDGWQAWRSAGSHGPADVIAVKPKLDMAEAHVRKHVTPRNKYVTYTWDGEGRDILLIQCKREQRCVS